MLAHIPRNTIIAAVAACLLAVSAAHAQPDDTGSAEARFLDAREAARVGNRAELERLAGQITGQPLDSYVRYWLLFNKLTRPELLPEGELRRFLADEPGTLLAERLRADWLRRLAKDGNWSYFLQIYPELQNPDNELRCHAWNARLMTGDRDVLNEVANAWPSLTYAHAACAPVLRAAVSQRAVSTEDVWHLFRRRVDTRSPARARAVLAWLAEDSLKSFNQAVRNPKRYLDRLSPKATNTRAGREIAMVALTRIARDDVDAAHARFRRL
ncbi:MAG: transglycosylase, partial [Azoarcus sp.]|nr:transglycosylase [Azoarcus sp.]